MPTRLAIQASRVHNAWLCLIWIVLFFRPQAKKAMRSGNATTMAASRHPDHRPLVTPAFSGSLQDFRHLAGFLFLRTSPCGVPG